MLIGARRAVLAPLVSSGGTAFGWSAPLSHSDFVLSGSNNSRATRSSGAGTVCAIALAVSGAQDVSITIVSISGNMQVGFADASFVNTTFASDTHSLGYASSGQLLDQGLAPTFTFGSSPATGFGSPGDILRMTTDGLGSFSFYLNGVLQATMSHPAYSGVAMSAACSSNGNISVDIA